MALSPGFVADTQHGFIAENDLFGTEPHTPFGLSLSKPRHGLHEGFDRLSPNGLRSSTGLRPAQPERMLVLCQLR